MYCPLVKTTDRHLRSHKEITKKNMYYNHKEEEQVSRLASLLSEDKFKGVQKRLEETGMRKGFACLFYGDPGTGKTETVLQIARATGRNVIQIDISAVKDKWVGESEKNIKGIFNRYRTLCSNLDKAPILFFNEADAIFGKRMEGAERSVDKMNNSIQNIILQEIENLDGILIATTNLTGSLDPAFERRFLFMIRFCRPLADVKVKIWKSMLGDTLSDEDIRFLATKYDFSGSEIENIARKRTVDYVLNGSQPTCEDIERHCAAELIVKAGRKTIGF